jgi:raffinose/stachyose/melibiose transport system substrate-binding protein
MFLRKRVSWVLLIVLAFGALVSCGEQAAGPVEVDFWHLDSSDEHSPVWQGLADAYTKLHPNVTFKITVLENEIFKSKISTVVQSGKPPHIFRSWGGGVMNSFAEAGMLKDITDQVKNSWDSKIGEGAVGVYSYKGKTYGLPYDMGCVALWYNKDLLKKVGYDAFPTTWKDLLELVKKLKAAGITPIALGEGDKWPGHFWWVYLAVRIGGKPAFDKAYSGEGSFADPTWVKAGELLKELIALQPFQKGFLAAGYGSDQAALMGNGQAAMELMGQWAPSVQASASKDKKGLPADVLGMASFPAVEGGAGELTDVMGGGNGLVIGKDAPQAAVDFLKFITNVENQKLIVTSKIGGIPTAEGAEVVLTDPNVKAVQAAVAKAKYFQLYYDQYLPPTVGAAVLEGTQGLFAGKMTPEAAAQLVDKAFKETLKK